MNIEDLYKRLESIFVDYPKFAQSFRRERQLNQILSVSL
jgi:hypothetical protein